MTNRVIKYRGKNLTDYYVFLSLWLAGHHRQGRSRYKYKTVGNNCGLVAWSGGGGPGGLCLQPKQFNLACKTLSKIPESKCLRLFQK